MLASIWRYSHFALAASSSLFVLVATVTGLFLAFEPIHTQLQPFKIVGAAQLPLADVIDTLTQKYDEVLALEVNEDQFVTADVMSMEAEELNGNFYINPLTGDKLGDIPAKPAIFEFMTSLHRSLFLKTTGRILVGITSFLLLLIAITGTLLFLKRQKGIRHFFDKLVKEKTVNFYHIFLGRWMLIPIAIITLTGCYLSLLELQFITEPTPEIVQKTDHLTTTPTLAFNEFEIFQKTPLKSVRKLEFPFSPDVEDFFILSLKDRELKINQKTGAIVETATYPLIRLFSTWSFDLHTGRGSIIWSIVLAIAAVNILFFMYSGGVIAYKRLRTKTKNSIAPAAAEYVILVGTENGSTRAFGNLLQQALLKLNKNVFLDDLNKFQVYPKMKELIVLTSTYGVGDPPANANQFLSRLATNTIVQPIHYTVVGFGSLAYPDFCQFALDVDQALGQQQSCTQLMSPHLIHNKSYTSFKTWAFNWANLHGLQLDLPANLVQKKAKLTNFTILEKQIVDDGFGETFTLLLRSNSSKFESGDLMGITPPSDPVERLYSIAKMGKDRILLSIKKHKKGICSNYLDQLPIGTTFQASLQTNKDFHFPKTANEVLLIGNGTGIAPYLGMIQSPQSAQVELYWGGKNETAFGLYKNHVEQALQQSTLKNYNTVFSRIGKATKYVQDLLTEEDERVVQHLEQGGYVMICGSISMQDGVLKALENLSQKHNGSPLSKYQTKGQILMDCY